MMLNRCGADIFQLSMVFDPAQPVNLDLFYSKSSGDFLSVDPKDVVLDCSTGAVQIIDYN